jgi:PhoH-like ATPase
MAPEAPAKLFVLDTNVLMHDPMCLFRFEEHDIFLPMIVLEELDGHKKGMTEVARNARQVSRDAGRAGRRHRAHDIGTGPEARHHRPPRSRRQAVLPDQPLDIKLPMSLPQGKADNQILGVVQACATAARPARGGAGVQGHQHARQGRALGLATEDYQTTRRWKTATCSTPACWPCRRLLGPPWQDHGKLAARAATPSTASAGRWCRRC